MKKIQFTTKNQSNELQREEFLALSYESRMSLFFRSLCSSFSSNRSEAARDAHIKIEKQKNNFILGRV